MVLPVQNLLLGPGSFRPSRTAASSRTAIAAGVAVTLAIRRVIKASGKGERGAGLHVCDLVVS